MNEIVGTVDYWKDRHDALLAERDALLQWKREAETALVQCASVLDAWLNDVDFDFEDQIDRQDDRTRDALDLARAALKGSL